MNHVERFRAVMAGQPVDRLPDEEWAMWWDRTIARWNTRRIAESNCESAFDIAQHFGLDPYQQFWFSHPPTRRSRRCSITWKGSCRTWTII